jgi:hypothetical protein
MWLVLFLDPTEQINRRLAPGKPPHDPPPRS